MKKPQATCKPPQQFNLDLSDSGLEVVPALRETRIQKERKAVSKKRKRVRIRRYKREED